MPGGKPVDEKPVVDAAQEAEAIQANEAEAKEAFGEVSEDNAFGIKTTKASVEKEPEAKGEKPADAKPAVDAGKSSDGKEIKPEAGKETPAEVKDALLEQLKEKSPIFKELCEKKNFKNIDDAFKAYVEIEKLHGQKSNLLSAYRKGLEDFVTFDEAGNATGYTELGKKAISAARAPAAAQPAGAAASDILTPEQTAQLEQIKDKFFEMFEKNPIEAIVRIAMGVTQFNLKGHKDEFSKSFKDIQETLKPILEERENQKMLSLIDDVAKEQISAGDEKANEFIDEYAPEIEAELKKIDSALRKTNPKLAIQQAYLIVKDKKVQEWQKQLKEKQDKEQREAQDGASSGAPGGGGAEPEVDPVIQGMEVALKSKSDGSAFFGL